MTRKSYLKFTAVVFIATAVAAATAGILVPRLLDLETYRVQILSMAQKSLNRQMSYQTASFSWHYGPSFTFRGIIIEDKSRGKSLLAADQLTLRLALLPLLHNELRLRGIDIERPVLNLVRNKSGLFNISDLFTEKSEGYNIQIRNVRMKNGLIHFTDRFCDPDGFTTSLENLDLYVSSLARGATSSFKLSTVIPDKVGKAEISFSGTVKIPSIGKSLGDAKIDLAFALKKLDAGSYWPYYGRYLPFERIRGNLDIEGTFTGKPAEFTTKGRLRATDLRIHYPRVFHSDLAPKDLQLTYGVEYTPRKLSLTSLDLTVDGLRVRGSCFLDDIQSNDPYIRARVVISRFRLEEFRRYIPYGVIVKKAADFIEHRIKGGIFSLDEGRLDGRLSRILHMDHGNNSAVLSVRARVDQGLLTLGPRIPNFSNINGELAMEGKDFSLRRMKGNFGGSPFTLDGKITGYPLNRPAGYPFTMIINPGKSEVAWLFRQETPRLLPFSGPSVLTLSGSGTAADYSLTGSWDLSGASYLLTHFVHKPAGLANRLDFSARLGKTEARLTELRYKLPPLDLTASATYRYGAEAPLTFSVTTNRFTLSPEFPLLPDLREFHPGGKLQAEITGKGDPAGGDAIKLKGAVSLAEFSLWPLKHIKPVRGIDGTIHFTESSVETEKLTGRVGDTHIVVKGHVAGFSNPGIELGFSSPGLHLKDIGYQTPEGDPELKNLSGSVSLKNGNLAIRSLSGRVNRSSFTAQGEIIDLRNPKITLCVDFPYLGGEDLTPLTRLHRTGTNKGYPHVMALKVRVTSRAGSFRKIPFKTLDSNLSMENNRLVIQALNVNIFDGAVAGSGQVDFTATGGPLYQAACRLDHVDAAKLFSAAGRSEKISGRMTAEGELTARGSSMDDLRRNARVTAKLHMQDGEFYRSSSSGGGAVLQIPYSALDANLKLEEDIFTLDGISVEAFGGAVAGSGRVDFTAAGGPLYQAAYRLDHVDAAKLFRAAGRSEKISGQMSVEGELTARGSDPDELRKTVRGRAAIKLSDGMIPSPTIARGKARGIPIKEFQASLSIENNVIDYPSVRVEVFDGIIFGKGKADFGAPDSPDYKVSFQMSSVNAAKFFRTFEVTEDITGLLTLKGELTARGTSGDSLKKTVQGPVEMHLEKGVINRFQFLSKVFSILNVSHLLNFRLPDMVSTGMPYNRIDGNFSFQDGNVVINDLFLHSPSINLEVVGQSDIIKEEIDLKVGVQPLQTVSEFVSRIPVIGWILSGRDRSFLVTYYVAKGNWNNPTVSAIPFTSLPRGVFNIFKRAFTLPDNYLRLL